MIHRAVTAWRRKGIQDVRISADGKTYDVRSYGLRLKRAIVGVHWRYGYFLDFHMGNRKAGGCVDKNTIISATLLESYCQRTGLSQIQVLSRWRRADRYASAVAHSFATGTRVNMAGQPFPRRDERGSQ